MITAEQKRNQQLHVLTAKATKQMLEITNLIENALETTNYVTVDYYVCPPVRAELEKNGYKVESGSQMNEDYTLVN